MVEKLLFVHLAVFLAPQALVDVHHALTVMSLVGSHSRHAHPVKLAERFFQGASFQVQNEQVGEVGHLTRQSDNESVL